MARNKAFASKLDKMSALATLGTISVLRNAQYGDRR
jgi:hypothetical protein